METPSFKEDHISQIPALQMLVNLGYTYLSPAEADRQRGGKTTNVLLEDVLRKQLKEINSTSADSGGSLHLFCMVDSIVDKLIGIVYVAVDIGPIWLIEFLAIDFNRHVVAFQDRSETRKLHINL